MIQTFKKESYKKYDVLENEKLLVKELIGNKPVYWSQTFKQLCGLIDISINNFHIRNSWQSGTRINSTIKAGDCQEYKEMFHEILDIIKKHNRPYIEDGVKNPE